MNRRILTRDDLRPQQRDMVKLVLDKGSLMVVATMGSGKSGALLTAALHLLDTMQTRRVLVVAPLRVARDVWPDEARAWEHTRLISIAVAIGKPAEREAAVNSDAEITVINFENLVWLHGHFQGAENWPFDTVIVDESSMFKSGKKRTKSTLRKKADGKTVLTKGGNLTRFGALVQVRKKIRRIVLLTGTPAPKGVRDLWGQVYLIDQGQRLGTSITAFENRWFDKNKYSFEVKPKPGAEAEITSRVTDVMFSFPPPADLPEPVYVPVKVDLPKHCLLDYADFKRTMVNEVHNIQAVTQGVLTNKLLQWANGGAYREDRSVAEIHTAKLDALDDLIAQAQGDPMLILYSFKFDLERILKRHPTAVKLAGDDTVKDWNAGKIKLMLAHGRSCAHGLNLQFGGHLACWFGFTWSLELYLQANARLARPGQKNQVAIYQIIANGTDDQRLLNVLDGRNSNQAAINNAVRMAILES